MELTPEETERKRINSINKWVKIIRSALDGLTSSHLNTRGDLVILTSTEIRIASAYSLGLATGNWAGDQYYLTIPKRIWHNEVTVWKVINSHESIQFVLSNNHIERHTCRVEATQGSELWRSSDSSTSREEILSLLRKIKVGSWEDLQKLAKKFFGENTTRVQIVEWRGLIKSRIENGKLYNKWVKTIKIGEGDSTSIPFKKLREVLKTIDIIDEIEFLREEIKKTKLLKK